MSWPTHLKEFVIGASCQELWGVYGIRIMRPKSAVYDHPYPHSFSPISSPQVMLDIIMDADNEIYEENLLIISDAYEVRT